MSDFQGETLFPLLLQRMDFHNDPLKPYMTPEGIYEIGNPDKNSPVILTSSWALSFLHLSAAIETTDISAIIWAVYTEETDVMCWCPYCLRGTQRGEIDTEAITRFINKYKAEDRANHRKLLIPGRTAQFQQELEKALPDWEIIVGPGDSDLIPGFMPGFAEKLK